MLKTAYADIVDDSNIGQKSTRNMNDLLLVANAEGLKPASTDTEQVLLVVVDMQNDFMENGSLPVANSFGDVARLCKWFYHNTEKITSVATSLDTHDPFQIFHPCWWIDQDGNNPAPQTVITVDDVESGRWIPALFPDQSKDYVKGLKAASQYDLRIWPYHCIQGTWGASLEPQFATMLTFYEVARKSVPLKLVKGTDPFSEMYGIIKPEYDANKGIINLNLLNLLEKFDKIVVAGEAKDFSVFRSIEQMLDHYKDRPDILGRFYFLGDCSSPAVYSETEINQKYDELSNKYKINIVKSTDFSL